MLQIGEDMDYYGGFGEIGQHGREMISASQLALDWARGIERDEPWLRKVLDYSKREYKKRPAWSKPSNAGTQRRRDENAPLATDAQSRRSLE